MLLEERFLNSTKQKKYFSSDSEDETESEVADTSPVKVRKTEHCATCDKYFTKKGIKIHKHRTKVRETSYYWYVHKVLHILGTSIRL